MDTKWSKTERTRVHSFQLGFHQSTHLTLFLLNTRVYKRLSSLWNGVCYKWGVVLYLYYSKVGTELSVSCTQVRRLCLSVMPRESFRGCQVGPAGLP